MKNNVIIVACLMSANAFAQPVDPSPDNQPPPVSEQPDAPETENPSGPGTTEPVRPGASEDNAKDNRKVDASKPILKPTAKPVAYAKADKDAVTKAEKEPEEPSSTYDWADWGARSMLLTLPTGHLIEEGVFSGSLRVDTGGGTTGDIRLGLGNVAEFSLESSSYARMRSCNDCELEEISFLPSASLKIGVAEDRILRWFPAFALNFRKSFTREIDSYDIKYAQGTFIASKTLGNVSLHAGVEFWDASIEKDSVATELNARGRKHQFRPVGGIVFRPFDNSMVMADLTWHPDFRVSGNQRTIGLRPQLTWGVRYVVADWLHIESGVRVPDIGELRLLDAQIFGNVRIISTHFNSWIKDVRKK